MMISHGIASKNGDVPLRDPGRKTPRRSKIPVERLAVPQPSGLPRCPLPVKPGWSFGWKNYRKPTGNPSNLMVKTMVSLRFSFKPVL